LEKELEKYRRELAEAREHLAEALEQQTATSDVLQIISNSPGKLEPVFEAILANAVRICEAKFGVLHLHDAAAFRIVAMHGIPTAIAEKLHVGPREPSPNSALGRLARTKQTVHIADAFTEPGFFDVPPGFPSPQLTTVAGARTFVAVPMLKNNELVGAIFIYRQQPQPFTDNQIELVSNFAKQAVVAIENTRLLNELRESLQQQTATSEVLQVISSSPGELEPVFQAMLANAVRLCDAKFGNLYLHERGALRVVASHNVPRAFAEARRRGPFRPAPGSAFGKLIRTKQTVQTADVAATQPYAERDPAVVDAVELGGVRTSVAVPMLKDNDLVGAIVIFRQEVRPFTDKQIELVTNFAAQAVIAIENARLLNELRQRTGDLSEALEQQTATSEVLGVISSSPGELEPVFRAMLEKAVRVCDAKFGTLFRYDGELLHLAAGTGTPPAFAEFQRRRGPFRTEPGTLHDRVVRTKQVAHSADYTAEPKPGMAAKLGGARSTVVVPMVKDDRLMGTIVIYRQEVRPFTEKQIELVKNFAAQAVIAIENTRLLNELRQRTEDLSEALEQQTATSQVLQVISSSPGELEPVFQAMLENATRLCEAKFGAMYLSEGSAFRIVAMHNVPPAFAEMRRRNPVFRANPRIALARAAATKQTVQIADVQAEPGYFDPLPGFSSSQIGMLAGARTVLAVPMLKESELVGVIAIYRQEVSPFTDKQIGLVQNFGSQAVIAIENTRLLNELRESLQQQTATADVLKVISRSTFDLQTVLDTLVESAARLCEADRALLRVQLENSSNISRHTATPPSIKDTWKPIRSPRVEARCLDEPFSKARSFMFQMFGPIRIT
jgi:GAF domain-containing protein